MATGLSINQPDQFRDCRYYNQTPCGLSVGPSKGSPLTLWLQCVFHRRDCISTLSFPNPNSYFLNWTLGFKPPPRKLKHNPDLLIPRSLGFSKLLLWEKSSNSGKALFYPKHRRTQPDDTKSFLVYWFAGRKRQ